MPDNEIDHDYIRRRLAVSTVRDAINNLNVAISRAEDACAGTTDVLAFWDFRKVVAEMENTDQFRRLLALSVRGADIIKPAPRTTPRTPTKSVLAALYLFGAAAHAEVTPTARAGAWEAAEGTVADGTGACVASTGWPDVGRGARYFGIKSFDGRDYLVVHVARFGWTMPAGTPVRMTFQIDSASPWDVPGRGTGMMVEAHLPAAAVRQFFAEFRTGLQMVIRFEQGSESEWRVSLVGSAAITQALADCVARRIPSGKSAPVPQPFDPAPATPSGPARRG